MEILITDVAERMRSLCPALPLSAREIRPVPAPVRLFAPQVRLQRLAGGAVTRPQAGWSVDSGFGMGFYAADTKRDHGAMTHNSITFSTRQGPSCSPPV